MVDKLKVGQQLERSITIDRAKHLDIDARTVEVAFSSEEPYERFFGIEILDHKKKSVRMKRLKSRAAVLVEHDGRDHVGVIESARIDSDLIGRAVIRFGKSARAEEIFQDVIDGIRVSISVRYIIHELKLIETNKDTGQDTFRIMDWEPMEISLVSVAADHTVGVGRNVTDLPKPVAINIEEIVSMDTEEKRKIEEEATMKATATAQKDAKIKLEQEVKRSNEILALGAEFEQTAMAVKAVKDGVSLEAFQRQVLDAKKTAAPTDKLDYGSGARTEEEIDKDKKLGFKSLGQFAADVVRASTGKGISERLTRAAASLFANENAGEDGAYVIPPEFSAQISYLGLSEEALLPRTDLTPVSGNSMTFHKDESTPWQTSGVQSNWESEGGAITQTKPASIKRQNLLLKKLTVLVPASDELLADAVAMSQHITRAMGIAVDWKTQDAIVNGDGVGKPLGFVNGGGLVVQAKEGSQAADSVVPNNIAKMYSRLIFGAGANITWMINPDVFPQIITLTLNNNPIWIPNNSGFKGAPNGFLLGRPMLLSDTCQTLGDQNDIMLCNFAGYRSIVKSSGAEFAQSMHLWFDQGLQAFRLTFRMDGQPTLTTPVSPARGSVTRGHFITLAVRT